MKGTILQVSISPGGLPKRAIREGFAGPGGMEGDGHAHSNIHGGPSQALLLVCSETLDELAARGYSLTCGALGENLTTKGLDRRSLRAGQRYRAGEAVIELTRLRVPCHTLDVYGPMLQREIYDRQIKDGDTSSPRWGMSGFYAAVVEPGWIRPQDPIWLLDQSV